jgi:hypothetical protein
MALPAWSNRPPEVAALLNPAFCGLLTYAAVDGYLSQRGSGMPFEFTFLVLPLLLHEPTRILLPTSVRTPLASWIAANPVVRMGMGERVRESADLMREALMFMLARQAMALDSGVVVPGTARPRLTAARTSPNIDLRERVQQAALVGRLLSRVGTAATIFAILGLSP